MPYLFLNAGGIKILNHFCMKSFVSAKNGYYGSLVSMVRDAFLMSELVRIDCLGLDKKDYRKIGAKLRVRCFFLPLSLFCCPTSSSGQALKTSLLFQVSV